LKLYTLAGELIHEDEGPAGTVTWDATANASGIYIAFTEVRGPAGELLWVQTLKVLVRH
jgi:hypothetical protein